MNFVLSTYRNCAYLLGACDLLMDERGFSRYNWANVYSYNPVDNVDGTRVLSPTQADMLLTSHLFHQYYPKQQEEKEKEVVTICTAPWRRINSKSLPALCAATWFRAENTPDAVYLVGALPVWDKVNLGDGKPKSYSTDSRLWDRYAETYRRVALQGTPVITISIPLAEVTSSRILSERLIDPLLKERSR